MKTWKRLQDMTGMQFLAVLAVGICVIMAAFIVEGILGANAGTTPEETVNMHWSEFPDADEYDLVPAPNEPAELYPPEMPEQDYLVPDFSVDEPYDEFLCKVDPITNQVYQCCNTYEISPTADQIRQCFDVPPVDSWNQELNTGPIPDPDFN